MSDISRLEQLQEHFAGAEAANPDRLVAQGFAADDLDCAARGWSFTARWTPSGQAFKKAAFIKVMLAMEKHKFIFPNPNRTLWPANKTLDESGCGL